MRAELERRLRRLEIRSGEIKSAVIIMARPNEDVRDRIPSDLRPVLIIRIAEGVV